MKTVRACVFCGKQESIHDHHLLPRKFYPNANDLTVPVCASCHRTLHYINKLMEAKLEGKDFRNIKINVSSSITIDEI